MSLEFEWDPAKSESTYQDRGIDFAYACRIFLGPVHESPADRNDEPRTRAIGWIEGKCYTVIYTVRGLNRYRIISARRARPNEERAYRALHLGQPPPGPD
ncbi:MAG: BrnT family toxin [Gemmatimonadota bacterium]